MGLFLYKPRYAVCYLTYISHHTICRNPSATRERSAALSNRRPILSPDYLRRLLEVLFSFGFNPKRVDLSPDGGVTLHADVDAPAAPPDALADWEAKRASRPH